MSNIEKMLKASSPRERATTEKVLQSASLIEAIPYVKELLDAYPHVSVIINRHRQVLTGNEVFLKALGVDDIAAVRGKRPGEIFNCVHATQNQAGCGGSDACRACGAIRAVLESMDLNRKVSQDSRITVRMPDSRVESLDMRVTATPLELEGMEPVTVVIISDVSHEKRRKALERMFLHDVANAVGGIRGFAEFALSTDDPGEQKSNVSDVLLVSEILADLIGQYRDLIAAENGDLKVELRQLNAASFVAETAAYFSKLPASIGRSIKLEPAAVSIKADSSLLKHVLVNLLKNACEASSPLEVITLSCHAGSEMAELRVHNASVIPDEAKLQIFQRSFSTRASGRGLGLYGSRIFVERYMNGRITFESTTENGTTFSVFLPVSAP